MKIPLSAIIIRQGPLADSEPFLVALRKVLIGSEVADTYSMVDYELLNPVDFRVFPQNNDQLELIFPGDFKTRMVQQSESALIILLVASPDAPEVSTLTAEWGEFVEHQENVFLVCVSLGSASALTIASGAPPDRIVSLGLNDLDERDLRCDFLALHAVHSALRMLCAAASATPGVSGKSSSSGARVAPKLFFSHAKRDGVPLSTSLVSWIGRLKGFGFFYDTLDLNLSGDIGPQLEQAVGASVLVALRTEIFDQRYWCQEEVFWAEKHGVPVISVDARWSVKSPASVITLDGSPSVRIPDGSLVRILQVALEEALRLALHRARAHLIAAQAKLSSNSWVALSRPPSLVSLDSAAEANRLRAGPPSSAPYLVVYPNPALPKGLRDSATSVCQALIPQSQLLSLDEFRLYCA